MINEVDSYLVFLRVCELVDKCLVVKNEKGLILELIIH